MSEPWLIVIMGVPGSGKTTVGRRVAQILSLRFADADALHTKANIAKMTRGEPLTDADRGPWLHAVGKTLAAAGRPGLVVACSALKRRYRDIIRAEAPQTVFVQLDVPQTVLARRMASRRGHFMPTSLLSSQLVTLESLMADEAGFVVDATAAPEQLARSIARAIEVRDAPHGRLHPH